MIYFLIKRYNTQYSKTLNLKNIGRIIIKSTYSKTKTIAKQFEATILQLMQHAHMYE